MVDGEAGHGVGLLVIVSLKRNIKLDIVTILLPKMEEENVLAQAVLVLVYLVIL